MLAYQRWGDQRRAQVEEASGGRIGYLHIPHLAMPEYLSVYGDPFGRYRQTRPAAQPSLGGAPQSGSCDAHSVECRGVRRTVGGACLFRSLCASALPSRILAVTSILPMRPGNSGQGA